MSSLEPTSDWLVNVLDTIDEGIHAVNQDGVTIVYNAAAGRLDGLSPGDVIGKHVLSVFPSLGQESSTLLQVLKTGQTIGNRPQTYTNLFGVKVHTVNTTLPIVVGGKVVGALEVAKDLTQVKRLTEQLLDLQAQVVGGGRSQKRTIGQGRNPDNQGHNRTSYMPAVYRFSQILTQNRAMEDILQRAERAAQTSSPILVYGETGTGKELIVQAIHNASPRAQEAFLAVNCAALPSSLLEGILFGTVRGSFTGAEDRPGMFELADGGTLFLDEIQSMPLELQAKLLRVLQEGEMMRVGDTRIRKISVRVIAALNQRPEMAVESGLLRQDLYFRINVVRLNLPPLRARRDDIPVLTRHFIDKWNGRFGAKVSHVSALVMRLFQAYPWPGNIRELENAIEAALNVVSSGVIEIEHLTYSLREFAEQNGLTEEKLPEDESPEISEVGVLLSAENSASTGRWEWAEQLASQGMQTLWTSLVPLNTGEAGDNDTIDAECTAPDAVVVNVGASSDVVARSDGGPSSDVTWQGLQACFERIVLERALQATNFNVKQTAFRLGIPRQTLQYRLKQLGLRSR